MPTANGTVKSIPGGTKFASTFVIDGMQYHFSGNLNFSLPDFSSNEATVEYTDLGQLTTQRNFDGQIGPDKLSLNIINGPKIVGSLNMPIDTASRVSGNGMWIN
ncbi:hypothetical protein F4805DRAFT_302803 [Annulohypoxylon moriforme]|nr:hypothetical protein F4805DRAFT_302803 [Annulohypoxylon moriforme]